MAYVLIALILFILTFFQLVISVQSNLRDDSQQLGVLRYYSPRNLPNPIYRAIGMKNNEVMKITLYEAVANLSSATIMGTIIGVTAAALTAAVILMFVEMPYKLILSYGTIVFMIVMASLTIVVGTVMGA